MVQGQKPLEILVIDDNPDITDLLARIIRNLGHNVSVANDGQEGIEKYVDRFNAAKTDSTKRRYDIVFTDLNMPRKSGTDVTREVKKLSPNIPVYVITAHEPTEEYAKLAKELGQLKPDGVIQKPLSKDTLTGILESVSLRNEPNYRPPTTY